MKLQYLYLRKNFNLNLRVSIFILFSAYMFLSCSNDEVQNRSVQTSQVAKLYATTHGGEVRQYDINTGQVTTFSLMSSDAEGVYFEDDSFTVVSRIPGRLETYNQIGIYEAGNRIELEADILGSVHLQSPRDLAVSENYFVVSDNTDLDLDETTSEGRIFIYVKNENGFQLRNVVTTRFKVWGLDFIGQDLYAAVDETNKIAVFRNFLSTNAINGTITANKIIAFQGLVRSHGLDYENGTMVLSDIGEPESKTDGGLHIIENFDEKFNSAPNGGFIESDQQLRIAGNNTLLGNPVNIIYDNAYNVIFVAEAANNGGRVLAFNNATSVSGNISPDLQYQLPGVSSVFYYTE